MIALPKRVAFEPVKPNIAYAIVPKTARNRGPGSYGSLMHIAAQQSKILFGRPMADAAQTPSQGHKDLKSVGARVHPSGDLSATEAYGAKCHHL
ncbi:hypothetical protein [Mesorhizobium sp. WSM3859]|uniref:hypothetical protein n=1 Tax=Mesorhizobium sp. WSM3859 TaxID=2029402 RepID=UPI001140B479|nr:hypothetical protein [Mesorhizobium sp. WSM3859]